MSDTGSLMSSQRLACLSRAAAEASRQAACGRSAALEALRAALERVDAKQQRALFEAIQDALPALGQERSAAGRGGGNGNGESRVVDQLLEEKAGLSLRLERAEARNAELEGLLSRGMHDQSEATETLEFKQKQVEKLQGELDALRGENDALERNLTTETARAEQLALALEKAKDRGAQRDDQATSQSGRIQALEEENETLRRELEQALQTRDRDVKQMEVSLSAAESQSAEAVLGALWQKMSKRLPDVYVDTHAADVASFERICEVQVDVVGAFVGLEQYVMSMLKVLGPNDTLSRVRAMLKKTPSLSDSLREYVTTGRGKAHCTNLLRAYQAWVMGFGNGLWDVICASPDTVREQMSVRKWEELEEKQFGGWGEERRIAEYIKGDGPKRISDRVGTALRAAVGNAAYRQYERSLRR